MSAEETCYAATGVTGTSEVHAKASLQKQIQSIGDALEERFQFLATTATMSAIKSLELRLEAIEAKLDRILSRDWARL